MTPITINLSHTASKVAPNLETKSYFLAILPSIASVKKAIINTVTAAFKLPVKYKTVIILHYYDFMPIKDIARTLNISEGAVKKRLERARKQLKEYLERN